MITFWVPRTRVAQARPAGSLNRSHPSSDQTWIGHGLVWAARAQTKAHRIVVMNNSSGLTAAADGGCGVIRFSTSDYAPRKRLDAWREICSRTIQNMAIEPVSTERLDVKATMRQMPGLALAAGRSSPLIFQRHREFIDHDDVVFVWGLTSRYQAGQLGRILDIDRGQAVVLTGAEPAFLRVPTHGNYMSLRVPARSVSTGFRPRCRVRPADTGRQSRSAASHPLPCHPAGGRHLRGARAPKADRNSHSRPSCARRRSDAGHRRDCQQPGERAARLHAIREDIANRLDEPELSLARIAAMHRVKPRYVQRLFESEGTTFADYVLTQRLAFAHRLLSDPFRAGVKISAIALDAGFGDLSYFNRTFRRRYGMTPSELRAAETSQRRRLTSRSMRAGTAV